MIAITYRLRLLQPLLATAIQGDPNSSTSFDYIPGSSIRGALIARYLHKNNLASADALDNQQCNELFFSGTVRFLHAYPLSAGKQRTVPTPLSLLRYKSATLAQFDKAKKPAEPIAIFNGSHLDWTVDRRRIEERRANDTLKPIGKLFCTLDTTTYFYEPDHNIAVHIQREPVKGRALRGDGEVFQYDALAAEQCFGGIILVDTESDATEVRALLEQNLHLWLGRSRSANYGRVAIEEVELQEYEADEPWREYSDAGEDYDELPANQTHTMTLLSALVLRSEQDFPSLQLSRVWLLDLLGLSDLAPEAQEKFKIDQARTFMTIEYIGGFNRAWHMPLNQNYVLAAGSVISFISPVDIAVERVQAIESQGIGERRSDGYGRVAFNLLSMLTATAFARDVYIEAATVTEPVPQQQVGLAERMARRRYRQHLERKIVEYVNKRMQPFDVYNQMPANSQLGRMLVLVRQALPAGDVDTVLRRFNQFKAASKDQFVRARLNNRSLDVWLTTLLEQPEQVWGELEFTQPTSIAGYIAQRNARIAALQLIAAVLAAPARLRRQAEEAAHASV